MITHLLVAALQVFPAPDSTAGRSPFAAAAVIDMPAVGQLVLTQSPSPGLSAVRVFVPFSEHFGESGSGRVLTELATQRVRGVAARTGAQFAAVRSGGGIAYTATGADLDLDYLFVVLARALSEPLDGRVALGRSVGQVLADLEPAVETGGGWVTATLTDRMCPTTPPWVGTRDDLLQLNDSRLRNIWSRTHTRGSIVVTVSTNLSNAVVLAGIELVAAVLSAETAAPASVGTRAGAGASSRPPAVLRRWYGEARPVPAGRDAAARTVGALLQDQLGRESNRHEVFAEYRETTCGPAIVTVGSAFRGAERVMRQRVTSFTAELAQSIDPTAVAAASARERLRLLSEADLPAGRARTVGALYEGRSDSEAMLRDLASLTLEQVVDFLNELLERDPLRAEVNP